MIIICLNTIGCQQKIITTRIVNYLLKLLDHITDYDFTYIPRYSLSTWVREKDEKLQNIHIEKQITLITILKHSKFKNFIKYTIWRAPKSRGETHLKVSQSQVAESWDLVARSWLPTLKRGRGPSWEPRD